MIAVALFVFFHNWVMKEVGPLSVSGYRVSWGLEISFVLMLVSKFSSGFNLELHLFEHEVGES